MNIKKYTDTNIPFDYNTTRQHLIYAEYGRNIQNMVKFIKTLESKEERNKHAQAVIDLMGFFESAFKRCC